MKKIASAFLIILIANLLTSSTQAQDIRFGLTASPNINWFAPETEDYNSEGLRIGFSYGLLTEFLMAEHYGFASGMKIMHMGGKLSFPVSELADGLLYQEKDRIYKLQYLEIPLTLKMKTREIGYNTYFGVFGFGGGINLRARADDKFTNTQTNQTFTRNDIDIKSEIPFFRASMILGIGLEHSLGGNTSLVGGLVFNNGFTNTLKGTNMVNNKKQNARANYIEISLGVLF